MKIWYISKCTKKCNLINVRPNFRDIMLIFVLNYFSISGTSPIKCQLMKSKKSQLKPHPSLGEATLITILLVNRLWPTWSAERRRLLGKPQQIGEHSDLTSQTDSLRLTGTYPTERTPTLGNPITTKWNPITWPNRKGYRLVDALASPSCDLQDLATCDKADQSLRYWTQSRQLRSIQVTRRHVSRIMKLHYEEHCPIHYDGPRCSIVRVYNFLLTHGLDNVLTK